MSFKIPPNKASFFLTTFISEIPFMELLYNITGLTDDSCYEGCIDCILHRATADRAVIGDRAFSLWLAVGSAS